MEPQRNTWNRLYECGLVWKKTSKGLSNIQGRSVLELGVGNGKTLKTIIGQKPKTVVAIDISEEAIIKCKGSTKSKNVLYITKDFLKFNTKDKFNTIVCYYFLNNFIRKDRIKVVNKIKSLLEKGGIILFEDFAVGDLRQKGKEIEKNTMEKQNGLICHFFEKEEIKELFYSLDVEIQEKSFSPIRKNRSIKRKIINAVIKKNAPGRI